MNYITYQHIKLTGIEYEKIVDFQIEHKLGEHARAVLIVETAENVQTDNIYVGTEIGIYYNLYGKNDYIFRGLVRRDSHVVEAGYSATRIELASMSILLDEKPISSTYQQSTLLYETLMQTVVGEDAVIVFGATDMPLGSWKYRNGETSWAFIKRLASECGACIFTNIETDKPVIYVGSSQEGCADLEIIPETYLEGDTVKYRTCQKIKLGMKLTDREYVDSVTIQMMGGILIYEYSVGDKEAFRRKTYYNANSACKMLEGIVEQVDKEKIKVFFDTIDAEADGDGDCYFEYSTAYASKGGQYGAGFYCMPEVGDRVKVLLPDANEGTAFVYGSVSAGPLESVENAKLCNTFGKEILFTEKEIRISCNGQNMYISMTKDGEITIRSEKKMAIQSQADINIYGKKSVNIYAPQRIEFVTNETTLSVDKEKILINGENLRIN